MQLFISCPFIFTCRFKQKLEVEKISPLSKYFQLVPFLAASGSSWKNRDVVNTLIIKQAILLFYFMLYTTTINSKKVLLTYVFNIIMLDHQTFLAISLKYNIM